jgi:hypothetical protein
MMTRLPWRVGGVVLLAACVVAYEPTGTELWHRLVLPLAMAAAAWLMVQNVVAVALGTALLAGIHSAPGGSDPVQAIAYPVVTAAATVVLVTVWIGRFRARIRATHQARWQDRPGTDRAQPEAKEER